MKKTFEWLDDHNISYDFHDYKKVGADDDILKKAIDQSGWDTVINKRGTTWRNLPDETKDTMDKDTAFTIAHEKPSIIKRPIIDTGATLILGFDTDSLSKVL